MSSTLISKKSTKTARRSLHNPQHTMMKSPAQCRAFCWCLSAMSCLHQKKSRQLIHVLPSSLILLVSFPAGMLPETFESRERIGASASWGGNLCGRGGFTSLPQLHGGPKGPVKWQNRVKTQIAGAGGPWIASIAYGLPQDPRSKDRPSFSSFNGQTQMRAWQREKLGTAAFQQAADWSILVFTGV